MFSLGINGSYYWWYVHDFQPHSNGDANVNKHAHNINPYPPLLLGYQLTTVVSKLLLLLLLLTTTSTSR